MSLLRQYHAAIGEIIIKYSGTLEHYAGDGVMVFFNDPIPVPNLALQAVQTALDMRTAIGALIEKWRRLGHELGFGVGIAHGFATLGTIGFEGRFDYAAIGTVSNVASRLCDETAKPGQILISPRVLMAVEDAVNVEPVGDFTLKGISCPVAAYNVLSAVPPQNVIHEHEGPLSALSRHFVLHCICPLSGVKQTCPGGRCLLSLFAAQMSANDPKRTSEPYKLTSIVWWNSNHHTTSAFR